MTEYKSCIVCGKNSNGKPQCKDCWNISQEVSINLDYDYDIDIFDIKEMKIAFNEKLKAIKKANTIKNRQLLYNELIGIGFAYPIDDSFQKKAYKEITKLNNELPAIAESANENTTNDYRKQNPANIYCQDGHYVRSKEERAIDDYLYKEAKLLHAYEPKFRLTQQEQSICKKYGQEYEYFYPDFYIPQYNLYIEFFGKNDEFYNKKMDLKIKIFSSRNDINFKYLTYNDSNILLEKLEDILQLYKQKYK